jgi:hypothetical protein
VSAKQRVRALTPEETSTAVLRAAEDLLDDVEKVAERLENLLGELKSGRARTEEMGAILEEALDALEFAASRAETIRNVAAGRAYLLEGEREGGCALCGGERVAELVVHLPAEGRALATVFVALCEKCAGERIEKTLSRITRESWKRIEEFTVRLRERLERTPRSEWGAVVSEMVEEYQRKYGYDEGYLLSVARAVASMLEKGESL